MHTYFKQEPDRIQKRHCKNRIPHLALTEIYLPDKSVVAFLSESIVDLGTCIAIFRIMTTPSISSNQLRDWQPSFCAAPECYRIMDRLKAANLFLLRSYVGVICRCVWTRDLLGTFNIRFNE